MNKLLLQLFLLTTFTTVSYAGQNYLIGIDDYPKDIPKAKLVLATACEYANFGNTKDFFEDELIPDSLFMFLIQGFKGYACLYINKDESSCAIEFFCEDDEYKYEDFFRSVRSNLLIMDIEDPTLSHTDLIADEALDNNFFKIALENSNG